MSVAQQFQLPTMPFNREITYGCPVGSIIQLKGKPYQDRNPKMNIRLITNNNDTALRIEIDLSQPSKVKIDCTVSQKTSTSIETPVIIPIEQQFVLVIKSLQYAFQIDLNGSKISDFVHRVDPNLIKKISIEGPLICEEVIIDPQQKGLPSYEQAINNGAPTDMFENLSLNESSEKKNGVPNDLPPPPPSVLPSAPPAAQPTTSTNPSPFFYSGNSQGFSAHPYPLPGLIDNNTHPSQQNPTNPLAQPIVSTTIQQPIVTVPQTTTVVSSINPLPPASTISVGLPYADPRYSTTPISQPYATVTQPQIAPPIIMQSQQIHQLDPTVPVMGQGVVVPQSVGPIIPPPIYQNTINPAYPYPPVQYPLQAPPISNYMYPTTTPYVQGYVQPSYYQMPGYYPNVYDMGYHHHGYHHHHHCD